MGFYRGKNLTISTNHSCKNACHFPTSGTDRTSTKTLFHSALTAGCRQFQLCERNATPNIFTKNHSGRQCKKPLMALNILYLHLPGKALKVISALKYVFLILFFVDKQMLSPDNVHVKLITYTCI